MIGVEEEKILELVIFNHTAVVLIQLLQERLHQSLLGWDLQLDQHGVQLVFAQHSVLVGVELAEQLLEDVLFVGAAGHLDKLEPHYFYGLFDFLH